MDTGAGVGLLDDGAAVANVRADARKRSKADDTQSVVVTDEDLRHTLLSPPAVPHRSPLTSGCRQVCTAAQFARGRSYANVKQHNSIL